MRATQKTARVRAKSGSSLFSLLSKALDTSTTSDDDVSQVVTRTRTRKNKKSGDNRIAVRN
jgi:hypothetical protein